MNLDKDNKSFKNNKEISIAIKNIETNKKNSLIQITN